MSIGELLQFCLYSLVVGVSVGAITETYGEISKFLGALDRIGEIFNTLDPVKTCYPIPIKTPINGSITFKKVFLPNERNFQRWIFLDLPS